MSSEPDDFSRATLNLLEDFAGEKKHLEGALKAAFNILEDFAEEKRTLRESQRAQINILEDFDEQRTRVERTNRILTEEVDRRWKAESELKAHVEALARSNEELEQFAYVASHDLQEPLRKIQSYCQLLERRYKGQLDERAGVYIDYLIDGSNRMQNLVRDLLAFARVRSAGRPLQPVDSGAALKEALGDLETRIKETAADIRAGALPWVTADFTQLTQVFQNLLSNALKFRRPEGKPVIEVSARREAGFWHFEVRDNGIGIEAEHQERIFVIFQRLHGKSEYPGTGIGLAICKRVVERFGGRIWVKSALGEGAAFHFTIPAANEAGE